MMSADATTSLLDATCAWFARRLGTHLRDREGSCRRVRLLDFDAQLLSVAAVKTLGFACIFCIHLQMLPTRST